MGRNHGYDERPTDELIQLYERAASEHGQAKRRVDFTAGGIPPIAGGAPKQLTHFSSGPIKGFDVWRDGEQLVLDRGTWNQDVVLIRDVQ